MSDGKHDLLGYAITGKEFVAMDDLKRFGIEHWRGTRIEFERRGKQRAAEPHEYPALHNYIWMRPTNAQMRYLSEVRFLGSTFHWLSDAAINGRGDDSMGFKQLRSLFDARLAEAKAVVEAMEKAQQAAANKALSAETRKAEVAAKRAAAKAALTEFRAGEEIVIRDGVLAGEFATFRRVVIAAEDAHPFIEAEMEIMGRVATIKVDPLSVKRAAIA